MRLQEVLELEWSPDSRQVLTLLVQSVPSTALRQFSCDWRWDDWTGRLSCRWVILAVACDGCCNGRGECKCWDLHRWRSVIIPKDSAGAESWMRLEGQSRRKEVQERCITQSPKVAAYVANIVRGKISVQGLVIGRGQGHRRDLERRGQPSCLRPTSWQGTASCNCTWNRGPFVPQEDNHRCGMKATHTGTRRSQDKA